ncbi:MAG: DUF3048 C-terminal domain-containing protein [Clostridia bacterium]|nr:DUF3048 C-terminal domain-containing protein [Clostridia bacterium]
MESKKNGNLAKLVAFFLTVSVLIAAIAFSAGGWQGDLLGPDSGNSEEDNIPTIGDADENTDGDGDTQGDPDIPEKIIYTSYITGLEITEEESFLKPLCILFDSNAPMYGISSSFLTVEIPVENGNTRMLAFTNDATKLGKLGSCAPTRAYISNIAKYFGGVLVSMGSDDQFTYPAFEYKGGYIDFSSESGYHYTEYGEHCYTNADLIGAYIKNCAISTVKQDNVTAPYIFSNNPDRTGDITANTVLISFDKGSTSELIYSADDGKYLLKKNSVSITDRLNDKEAAYDNVFVLYSDATTHETRDATQLVLDTKSGGSGYYIRAGKAMNITWSTNENGELRFYGESGETLEVLPGEAYIAFAKSSQIENTKIA